MFDVLMFSRYSIFKDGNFIFEGNPGDFDENVPTFELITGIYILSKANQRYHTERNCPYHFFQANQQKVDIKIMLYLDQTTGQNIFIK